VASKREIKELLRKALGSTMSEAELKSLADALSSGGSSAPDAEITEEFLQAQIKLNEELGRTKEALEALERLRAREVNQQQDIASQLDENGQLNKEEVERLKEREQALKDVGAEIDGYNRRKQESAEQDRSLGSLAQNVALSYYNMADAGVTVTGVFGKLKGSYKAVSKSFQDISKANDKFTASMDVAKGAMQAAFNSRAAQSIRKQGDILNQVTMQAQRWSDISKTMQITNQQIYKQTGQITKNNIELSMRLGKIGDSTKSLLMEDKALVSAQVELRNAYAFFGQENRKTQDQIVKTTALMEKAGVSAATTAENYELFRKSFGLSGEQAEEASRSLLDLSRELGQSPQKVAQDFSKAKNFIATYGRDGKKQFTKMAAISGKLGISVDAIMKSMDSMDTLTGAAKASAALNAVLDLNPQDRISQVMLNQARGAEKFRIISDAIVKSKHDLSDSHQRGRLREAATATGLKESEILKIQKLGKKGTQDLEKYISGLVAKQEKGATSTKEIDKQNARAMTADEKANKGLQESQTQAVEMVASLQTTMAENVWAVKAFSAVFSALGMIGPAIQGIRGARTGAAAAKAAGKSGLKGGLAGAVGGAARAAGAMRVYVVNTSDFGGGMGGGAGGGAGGLPGGGGGGGGGGLVDTAITTAFLADDAIDTVRAAHSVMPQSVKTKLAVEGAKVSTKASQVGSKAISEIVKKAPKTASWLQRIGSKIGSFAPKMGSWASAIAKRIPGVASIFQGADAYDRYKRGDYSGAIMQGVGAATGIFTGGLTNLLFEGLTMAKDEGAGDWAARQFGTDPFNPFAGTPMDAERHRSMEEKYKAKGMDKEGHGQFGPIIKLLEATGQGEMAHTKWMRDYQKKVSTPMVKATMERSKAGKDDPYGTKDMWKFVTSGFDGQKLRESDYAKDLKPHLTAARKPAKTSKVKTKDEAASSSQSSALDAASSASEQAVRVKTMSADLATPKALDDFEFGGRAIKDVKEGGLLADKLERLIQLADMVDEEIVIQVGSKTIAKATLSAMNNNIYN